MNIEKMNESLCALCVKYSVHKGCIILDGKGNPFLEVGSEKARLLPWRVERRFAELKNLIVNRTLEDVSTLRFASVTSGGCLKGQLFRELDLASWMTGKKITRVFGVCAGDCAANVIAKLEGGLNLSIECSNSLPAGSEIIDRHEIIASRGVASDRGVDTQVPQSSIYLYTDSGEERYTDVDSELFGFSDPEIWIVRAAFAVLSDPTLAKVWNEAAETGAKYAAAVFESDKSQSPIVF